MALDFSTLWNFSDPAASEGVFRSLLEDATARPDFGDRAEILTQLARAQGLQRRFDEAEATLAEAQRFLAEPESRAHVRVNLERGRVHNSSGRREQAAPFFAAAWEAARRIGADDLAVDAAHMLGIVLVGDDGMAWNQRALALAEIVADPAARKWKGSLLNNIAWTLHDSGRAAEAMPLFERALAERRAAGVSGPERIARWCVARCLRSLGRFDEALSMQLSLEEEHARAGSSDGFVQEELGECLLALNRSQEARAHFLRAHALLAPDALFASQHAARLQRMQRMGSLRE